VRRWTSRCWTRTGLCAWTWPGGKTTWRGARRGSTRRSTPRGRGAISSLALSSCGLSRWAAGRGARGVYSRAGVLSFACLVLIYIYIYIRYVLFAFRDVGACNKRVNPTRRSTPRGRGAISTLALSSCGLSRWVAGSWARGVYSRAGVPLFPVYLTYIYILYYVYVCSNMMFFSFSIFVMLGCMWQAG